MKNVIFLFLIAVVLCGGWGCKRRDPGTVGTGMTDHDRAKLKAFQERMESVVTLSDLPARYHDRTVPSLESGISFEVYQDGTFLRAVRAEDFSCSEEKQQLTRKGAKTHNNCPLLPFLQELTDKPIVYLEVVGEGREFVLERFFPAGLETENIELSGFLAPRGRVRVEARPRRSLMTVEEAAAKGLREGRGGGKKQGRKQRGAMRGQFRTRSLYWVDLFSEQPPPEPAAEAGQPAKPAKRASARMLPNRPGSLALVMPGGKTKWLTEAEVESCGEAGCVLAKLLPWEFEGLWCVNSAGGVMTLTHAVLTEFVVKGRRQGGAVLKPPAGTEGEIRNPTSIAPCR